MRGRPDTTEQAQPRIVMCPKCHRRFETMRRFQMACTECGYEWDEASKLSAGERFSRFFSDGTEFLFVWISWAIMGGLLLLVASIFAVGFVRVVERRGAGTGVALFVVVVLVMLAIAGVLRPRFEAQARMNWWRMGWRGGVNDPKDNWD